MGYWLDIAHAVYPRHLIAENEEEEALGELKTPKSYLMSYDE